MAVLVEPHTRMAAILQLLLLGMQITMVPHLIPTVVANTRAVDLFCLTEYSFLYGILSLCYLTFNICRMILIKRIPVFERI